MKDIIIKTKYQMGMCERILPSIIYELNNHKTDNIDGYYYNYDNNNIFSYFEKRIQDKTEHTLD
jgi:hypothetical protein